MIGVWERETTAPAAARDLAESIRPGLGEWCHRIGMIPNGTRFAFVFDNPHPLKGYWWMELPPTPERAP